MPARVKRDEDADLMRFCANTARTLNVLTRRIAARTEPAPNMEAAFDDLAARLNAALDELDTRYSGPIKGIPND